MIGGGGLKIGYLLQIDRLVYLVSTLNDENEWYIVI
jgi:hypothetical protein